MRQLIPIYSNGHIEPSRWNQETYIEPITDIFIQKDNIAELVQNVSNRKPILLLLSAYGP